MQNFYHAMIATVIIMGISILAGYIFYLFGRKNAKVVNDEIARCKKQHEEIVAEYNKLRDTHVAYVKVVDEHIVLLEQIITLKDDRIKFLQDQYNALNGKITRATIEGENG